MKSEENPPACPRALSSGIWAGWHQLRQAESGAEGAEQAEGATLKFKERLKGKMSRKPEIEGESPHYFKSHYLRET